MAMVNVKEQEAYYGFGSKKKKAYIRYFNSINDFITYITDTPVNQAFSGKELKSSTNSESFTKTSSYDEALQLLHDGWTTEAKNITAVLNSQKNKINPGMKAKPTYSVQGFQASVPRYIQGIPTNMIGNKMVPVKNKVITISKSVSYAGWWKTEDMIKESIKAIQLINKLENQGFRCNVNVVVGSESGLGTKYGHGEVMVVRVKSANERINVSKMAFPLAHPSMLRRFYFRYAEVAPTFTKEFVWGYGTPLKADTIKFLLTKGSNTEFVIPEKITVDINNLTSLDQLK